VEGGDVHFLALEDGRLSAYREAAVHKTVALLRRYRPEEVYIPYHREPPADHRATTAIVYAALKEAGHGAAVYEYPIWFWHHWPWVPLWPQTARELRQVARNSLVNRFGWRLLTDFQRLVPIGDLLARKREALNQHQSQMQQLRPDPRWLTLADVSDGEFLACFFQEYEIFHVPDGRL
jgi:LmbE family N-acetylglucosaminyl deacetylase